MSSQLPTPSWVCRLCTRGIVQQRRGLRTRPRARPQPVEAAKLPQADTITLTDGTTIQIQAERPQRSAAIAPAPTGPPTSPAQPAKSPPPAQRARDTGVLIPSPPSAPLQSYPKSKSRAPPETPPTGPHDYNWYYETAPPTAANKAHANSFFDKHGKQATLLRSIAHFRSLPATSVPEVAFIGRSNVGKSSLLNAVMGCDTKALLARTSRTPGFTKTMNLYGIAPDPGVRLKTANRSGTGLPGESTISGAGGLTIVDMPGYGTGSLTSWGVEIMKYIQSRKALRRVFILIDASHGLKDSDRSILASLRLAGVSHQLVLSKMDKLYIPAAPGLKRAGKSAKIKPRGDPGVLRAAMRNLLPDIRPPAGGAALGELLACSAEVLGEGRRLGVEEVRCAVLRAVGLEGEERRGWTEGRKARKAAAAEVDKGEGVGDG